MFFKLILRNSKRSRKENGLFFSSLLVAVMAFYVILSLPRQDVMVFLSQMESDAVEKLLTLIPAFYGMTLFLLFFLIYYASRFQLERRRHEFGVYLMLGMRRSRLFVLLLAEDFGSSILSLALGLPFAVLLSELISLITARLVGIGIIEHQFSFSFRAMLWTAAGFFLVKCTASLLLSGRISRQEIGSLLTEIPEGAKRQMPSCVYVVSLLVGMLCLTAAYALAIHGEAWTHIRFMGLTIVLGLLGTFLVFWGLRLLMGFFIRKGNHDRRLHTFDFRQIQETLIRRFGTLALCSLLILAALCCFGTGTAVFRYYENAASHVLDYTFTDTNASDVRRTLAAYRLDTMFQDLFEMKTGRVRTTEDIEHVFDTEPLLAALRSMDSSRDRDVLLNNLSYASSPYLIPLSCYNRLLAAAGQSELVLHPGEAAVYMNQEDTAQGRVQLLNRILETEPLTSLDGDALRLTGKVQGADLVTDRSITLSFALILPDENFVYYTQGEYDIFVNGILNNRTTKHTSLLSAISEINEELDETGLSYESYLQNMGRQLFFQTASSYLTIYLAVIFLIIANTVIGVQFLMSQQKTLRRYRTLVRIGAEYEVLCKSARRQIHWYFGIPTVFAVFGSLFGVRALFTGILTSAARSHLSEMMIVSAAMISALCMVEYLYITAVKRSSDRCLLGLMIPKREE